MAKVSFALLLFTCVYAAPAPRLIEVTLLRNSIVGYNFGAGDKQAQGMLDGTRTLHLDVPDEAADKTPEVILLENVNTGVGIALGAHVDIYDKISSVFKNPFWSKKYVVCIGRQC